MNNLARHIGLSVPQFVVAGLMCGVASCVATAAGLTVAQLVAPGSWVNGPVATVITGGLALGLGAQVAGRLGDEDDDDAFF